jgi:hypothetical protein
MAMAIPQWKALADHVMGVPERIYESWNSTDGWDNHTQFGKQFGEDGYSWCVMFDWDMYADVGLAGIVPKVDNVSAFSAWAQKHGWWSDYPSVGAWVNFGDGSHTEIVVGFDADNVYTKGGNSVQAGSTDNGQGNGVWRHTTARRSTRVTGYFAPHFLDGLCPPTADPHDPRGGAPVASWRWTGATTQEADMPLSTADLNAVANAVWEKQLLSPVSNKLFAAATFLRYEDANFAAVNKALAATQAAVTALATAVGNQHDDVDTATLVAAVTKAISEAVVKVDVSVHGDAPTV